MLPFPSAIMSLTKWSNFRILLYVLLMIVQFSMQFLYFNSFFASHYGLLRNDFEDILERGSHSFSVDPEAADCKGVLESFRRDEIDVTEDADGMNYKRSFATVTKTDKPFYVATHDKNIDKIRAGIMDKQVYYEKELTARVAEIFDEKKRMGEQSIMLDVGSNIGWFSLVAAAHGATKVYAFEPNMQNTVRLCESLSMNGWLHEDRNKDIVIPINKGIGNEITRKKLYAIDERNPGSFTFNEKHKNLKEIAELEMTTMDSFAKMHGWFEDKPIIALFKLDVEGFEAQVLEGAKMLIESNLIEKIAMEIKRRRKKEEKSKIIKQLFEAGYELYMHGPWMGPRQEVRKRYKKWEDLAFDIHNRTYQENVMFRLRK